MKLLSRLLIAGAVVALTACGSSTNSTQPTIANQDAVTMTSSGTGTETIKSPDMAAVMFAANQGEVDMANAALPKLTSSDVREFAQMMIHDHSDALTNMRNILSVNHIIQHEGYLDAIGLRNDAKKLVTNYNLSGGAIDRSYIADQVRVHEKVLNMLDTQLIPSSRGDLLTLFQGQRAAVAAHLDRARAILTNMQ